MPIFAPPSPGQVVQAVTSIITAGSTGTTVIPEDDTIPQITEGDEYITRAITPKSTTNRLYITGIIAVTASNTNSAVAAIFQDSTANALAANECYVPVAGATNVLTVFHEMAAGTTSSTTFRLRVGPAVAGTITINGFGGARKFGGVSRSSLTVIEVVA